MLLVVGLGNPGKQYAKTRHNVGWMVVDAIAKKNDWHESKNAQADYCHIEINGEETELLKPTTFMNNSGVSVAYAFKKHPKAKLVVIHDDIDIPLGEMKIQTNRSAAGHNGIKSIIEHLGTQNFIRFRIGIKTTDAPAMDEVLKKFSKDEEKTLSFVINSAQLALESLVKDGLEKTMTNFNKKISG